MKHANNFVLCKDICDPIGFKPGLMLDMTKHYSVIPLWMTLMLTQGHRVTEKVGLMQSSYCKVKVALSNSNVPDGWLCEEDDREEVL